MSTNTKLNVCNEEFCSVCHKDNLHPVFLKTCVILFNYIESCNIFPVSEYILTSYKFVEILIYVYNPKNFPCKSFMQNLHLEPEPS